MQWNEFSRHIRHLPTQNLRRIEQAFSMGKQAHGDQKRKSGEPYFSHPIAVALMLIDLGADADTIIAALLHDTIEDTTLLLSEIDKIFDGSVATLIDGVTKLSNTEMSLRPNMNEQTESLRKMFTLMQQDIRIMVIKLVDRLHNMQTVEFLPPERQRSLAQETLDVYVKIADRLCMQDIRDELQYLCIAVLAPEKMHALHALRTEKEQHATDIVHTLKKSLREHDALTASRTAVQYEFQTWDRLMQQLSHGGALITGTSFLSMALVSEDMDMCYHILGVLHQRWKREILSFQDCINAPQLNGYQGLHTTIILENGTRVRCKIRTKEMQEYARKGIATRCFSAKVFGLSEHLPWTRQISSIAVDTVGSSENFWSVLQHDILGDNILIHGPNDATVQLPQGATALDGAFYLLAEEALSIQSILVNGTPVPFGQQLKNAASLDFILAGKRTCSIQWLRSVQTGLAAAKIRTTLAAQSAERKLAIGKQLLQSVFTENKRGFLEELDEAKLSEKVGVLGYASMHDVYIAIADGRLQPHDVQKALLGQGQSSGIGAFPVLQIFFVIADAHEDQVRKVLALCNFYIGTAGSIRINRTTGTRAKVMIRGRFNTHNISEFRAAIALLGVDEITVKKLPSVKHASIIAMLILCWGFDPVLAKMLLTSGIDASFFALSRAWSMLLFALVIYWITKHRHRYFIRIPFHYRSLWIAGIALFCINIFTYLFLQESSPMLYNTILRTNAVLLFAPFIVLPKARRYVLATVLIGMTGIGFILFGPFHQTELLLAFAILAAFTVFTTATSHFQAVARVHARFGQLFLSTNLIAAAASLVLPFSGTVVYPDHPAAFLIVAGYSVVFVGIPYLVFHIMTENFGYATLSPWISVTVLVTLLSQIFLLQNTIGLSVLLPAATLLVTASLLSASGIRRFSPAIPSGHAVSG